MQLSFFGATQTVTGSRYLLECGERCVLVDCGLFQGYKHLRLKNWSRLPFAASEVDAVLLTHAHLDHSGYLPLLVKNGFKGPIYATNATLELCRILLPDSGHLQEEQAQFANRHGFSKHSPALPLYTEQDAHRCLKSFRAVSFGDEIEFVTGVRAAFTHELVAQFIRCAERIAHHIAPVLGCDRYRYPCIAHDAQFLHAAPARPRYVGQNGELRIHALAQRQYRGIRHFQIDRHRA